MEINNILEVSIKPDRYTSNIYNIITNFFNENSIMEKSSIVLTLIYLLRYKKSNSLITNKNIRDLIKTCLILSNKFMCDFQILGCGPLENHVLDKINWNLYVDKDEFEHIRNITINKGIFLG